MAFPGAFNATTTISGEIRVRSILHFQDKIDKHSHKQADAEYCRPPFLMIHASHVASLPDVVDPPHIQQHAVEQRQARDDGEDPCGCEGDRILTEIQESRGDGAEDDRELEPGEKGAFGGEVDFGFDADGHVDFWRKLDSQKTARQVGRFIFSAFFRPPGVLEKERWD